MDRVRASDTERDRVAALLGEAAAAGRLTVEELEARTAHAYAAVTRGELAALLADLPHGAPAVAPRAASGPSAYLPPVAPSESRWPGPRPSLPGDLKFAVQWTGPANPRHAGRQIIEHIVPLFAAAGYEISERTHDTLVLRRQRSETTGPFGRVLGPEMDSVTIAMSDRGDHSVTKVYGVAPQPVREALARLAT
jgi:hypothetical protein